MKETCKFGLVFLFLVSISVACQTNVPRPAAVSPVATLSSAPVFQSPLLTEAFRTEPQILFASARDDGTLERYVMNPDGTGIEPFEFSNLNGFQLNDFKWASGLDTFVAVLTDKAGKDDLYLVDPRGITKRITSTPEVKKGDPNYSSVSRQFVFVCAEQDLDICVVGVDGKGYLNLTNYYSRDAQPVWSPSGQQIVFVSNKSGVPDVYSIEPNGSRLKNLSHTGEPNGSPSWSPDGSKIVFNSQRDYNWEIYTMDSNGQHPINLSNSPAADMDPKWSPNGEYIAFRSDRSGNQHVFVMKVDGSETVDVTNVSGADVYNFIWSLDGTRIYYQLDTTDKSAIYVVDRDGRNPQNLTSRFTHSVAPQWIGN